MLEKELYKLALEQNDVPLVITDFNGGILEVSQGFLELFHVNKDFLVGIDVKSIIKIPELKHGLKVTRKVKGQNYEISVKKFSLEEMDFYLLCFNRTEQLKSSNPRVAVLRDLLENSLESENFTRYIQGNLEYLNGIFRAEGTLLLSKVKKPQEGFVISLVSKVCDDLFHSRQLIKNSPESMSIGVPVLMKKTDAVWPDFGKAMEMAGYESAWIIGISGKRDSIDSLLIFLFKKSGIKADPETFNTLSFLSYLLSLIYQTTLLKRELASSAYRDMLSKTYTQIMVKELLELEFYQAKRYDFDFSVMEITVENYTDIKNVFGALGADMIMQKVAKTLIKNIRKSDVVGRYKDNSFIIILPFTNKDSIETVLTRIVNVLKESKFPPAKEVKFSVSFTNFERTDESYNDILKRLKGGKTLIN